jgi:hypothetical protein
VIEQEKLVPKQCAHGGVAETVHVIVQQDGVPYELEQRVCADCHDVLDEKRVKRAAG